jgi:hypothetical protein
MRHRHMPKPDSLAHDTVSSTLAVRNDRPYRCPDYRLKFPYFGLEHIHGL